MSPTRVTQEQNPLRDPRDKRLPRIAGPSGLVLFGVTGDLARKKLMPAIYDLANRGLLPPGFALVGFARRDWADQDFGKIVYEAVKQYARTPFRESVSATSCAVSSAEKTRVTSRPKTRSKILRISG